MNLPYSDTQQGLLLLRKLNLNLFTTILKSRNISWRFVSKFSRRLRRGSLWHINTRMPFRIATASVSCTSYAEKMATGLAIAHCRSPHVHVNINTDSKLALLNFLNDRIPPRTMSSLLEGPQPHSRNFHVRLWETRGPMRLFEIWFAESHIDPDDSRNLFGVRNVTTLSAIPSTISAKVVPVSPPPHPSLGRRRALLLWLLQKLSFLTPHLRSVIPDPAASDQ